MCAKYIYKELHEDLHLWMMKSKTHWHEQLECKALSQVHALQPWSVIALAKFTSTASGDYECTLLRSPALDSSQVDPALVLNWKRMRRAASIVRQTSRRCSRPHRRKCPFVSVHVYENTKWKLVHQTCTGHQKRGHSVIFYNVHTFCIIFLLQFTKLRQGHVDRCVTSPFVLTNFNVWELSRRTIEAL